MDIFGAARDATPAPTPPREQHPSTPDERADSEGVAVQSSDPAPDRDDAGTPTERASASASPVVAQDVEPAPITSLDDIEHNPATPREQSFPGIVVHDDADAQRPVQPDPAPPVGGVISTAAPPRTIQNDDGPSAESEAQAQEAERLSVEADDARAHADALAADAQKARERVEDADLRNPHRCPNCRSVLLRHGAGDPAKEGSYHCNGCGACWAPGIREIREGHPAPTSAVATA